jgi:hypothetical protein
MFFRLKSLILPLNQLIVPYAYILEVHHLSLRMLTVGFLILCGQLLATYHV